MGSVSFKFPTSFGDIHPPPPDPPVVIVSFFGKSSYISRGFKGSAVDDALGRQVFCSSVLDFPQVDGDAHTEIKGYLDFKQKVLYLHLCGTFDVRGLADIYEKLKTDLGSKGYLKEWAKLRHHYARSLLFLFSVSHVLVCSHPSLVFDTSYIRLFRALDSVRQKVQGSIGDIISTISGVPKDWVQYGRLCTPRLLFLFEKCPASIKKQSLSENGETPGSNRKVPAIKKLEHAMEDQIYHVLRKNRIISKSSMNSLFAIPANQEFVFIPTSRDSMRDSRTELIDSVISMCNGTSFGPEQQDEHSFHSPSFLNEMNLNRHSFKGFLQQHIEQAFSKGFDDNVGRHSAPTFFEVPKFSLWLEVSKKVFEFSTSPKSASNSNQSAMLHGLLDTDVKFSESRCGKVLPLAIATYQENLPTHYTREYHDGRLAHALSVFAVHARGPLFEEYAKQVETECEAHWKAGKQMCQVLSLTGNPCTKPLHKGGGDGAGGGELQEEEGRDHSQLPLMEHCSGVVYVSACNCGRKQGPREDPFSMRTSNHDFYTVLGKDCGCCDLESITFPVFTPSTKDFRAAQLFSNKKAGKANTEPRDTEATTPQGNTQGLSFAAYVSGPSGGSDIIAEETSNLIPAKTDSETDSGSNAIVIQVSDTDSEGSKEKCLVRQPSTTEYLPGMLHSESPLGLLPQFPSWSLVCLGPSSLYSHNLGLQEQQQAGLMPGSAYLLPWDLTVRLEHQQDRPNAWPTVGDAAFTRGNKPLASSVLQRPRKTKRDTSEFVVKIFVGVEYECPRGHRFMCSAPDKVLKTSGSGLVKDNGNKITGNDMPLYFPCPCKNSKPLIAQLMRVHVVTPKAPVHVTLNPKVQPAPSPCPIFGPGCEKPIRLSQSAYWILRLPYVYVGDQGPYISPKEPVPISYGRLLAGMYGIMELSPTEKT
ncbi:nonsense-mediated mRNA decay factor SMG8 isoform X3 [Frankliniella occidentalis]|uniref:Nonsense-mediated mRNA decay factor SMG8 n=1 Tax=Frankliniella occidentalis TaxID=133901 RepID=A0A6J1SUJ2_FRAOC|nr:nonsense-mediated mRNA decay factor SMG8 isoform X3 [Frankliniella occidentalis]